MSPQRFAGRVAIVTGGATGIGAAVSRQLIAEGAQVLIGARRGEPAEALVREFTPEQIRFQPCDVTQPDQVEALVAAAVTHFGGLDVLINNAGFASLGTTPELDPAVWHHTLAVNLHAVFYACKAAIPRMRQRGAGSIVNVASISGLAADYGLSAYNAAKAGVINYTGALAIEHAAEGIRANVVCPGFVDTAMTGFVDRLGLREVWTQNIPLRRAGKPEEIARVIAFVASEEASFMTGSVVVADGGLSAATGQPNLPALLRQHSS